MERQTSISKRLRKVSDPLIQLITPSSSSSHGHGKAGPEDSFFDYGKKGWRAPKPPDSYLRRRPLYRKVSKEEIRYPLLHPTEDMHDLLVESATMSAERDKQRTANRPPERPPRPSLEERPLVVRDPQLRMEEQRVYHSVNTAKRPARPREEDLPYGAKGSIPKVLVSPEQPPPPAIGRRSERTREYSVAFPSSRDEGARAEDPPRRTYTPFAPLSSRDAHPTRHHDHLQQPPHSARSLPIPRSDIPAGAPGLRRNATVPEVERRPKPPPKDAKWLAAAATATATAHAANSALPLHAQSHARRVRRTSSSGDVMLPSQSTRHEPSALQVLQVQDGNVPRHARPHAPELRTVKSTPLSARQQQQPPPPPPPPFHAVGLPAHPAVHLDPRQSRHRHKPSNPDVPRDVTPAEALHAVAPAGRSSDGQQAGAHAHVRTGSHGMRPSPPDRAQERERERKRRREERERAAQERYYGKADTFARQITLALAEPERAAPLSADWDAFVAGGVEYRTKPLVVTRETKDREPRERYPRGGY